MTASATTPGTTAPDFDDEVVTHALVRDVRLPDRIGTLALLTLDNGKDHTRPSTFGPASVAELQQAVDRLRDRADAGEIVAVAITGKPFVFAVGADLSGIPHITHREQAVEVARAGHAAFASVMDLPVPTFAFVNGAVMGGGLELALSCDYRTISAGVPALAFPEVFLGLVPGWGGCYLLPRLVGPQTAYGLIIDNALSQNAMLTGPKAFKAGIADAMFAPVDFLEASIAWAAAVVAGQVAVDRADHTADAEAWGAATKAATRTANLKTGGRSPAAYRAVALVDAARTASRVDAFAAEDEALGDLIMSDELRAGLYAFDLVNKRARRPAGAPAKELARQVTKVGVVGTGLMAGQLALLFARRLGVPVVMTDLDEARVTKGVASVHAEVDALLEKRRVTPDRAAFLRSLVTGSTSTDGFADADLVIEAVFEEISVKKQVWADVEPIVSETCVLASNTSSLSITEMAAGLAHPERVVGLHFFNPVAVMPLLEVVAAGRTDEVTLATAFAVGRALKKTTILVKDSPSFVVNRLLGRFMGEFGRIVEAGTPVDVADAGVAGLAPMPPFVLLGLVGPAIALHNSQTLHDAFGERFFVSEDLRRIVAAGKQGYYLMEGGRPVLDPEVAALLETPAEPVALEAGQVRSRVLEALADETHRMLDEGVVATPMDIDLAMITGAGFQFWNGGVTPLLDREGASRTAFGGRFLPPGVASVPGPG